MISRLSLRTGSFGRILGWPDVQRQVMLTLSRGCAAHAAAAPGSLASQQYAFKQTPIAKHLENWERAHQLYFGPERDTENFPHPVRREDIDPVRFGFIPDSWFQAIEAKTGVTGPYILGAGLITFLISKELWVFEHGQMEFVGFWFTVALVVKLWGRRIGAYFENRSKEYEDSWWHKNVKETLSHCEGMVSQLERNVWQEDGQKYLFESKRENVALQLEEKYRSRLAQVYAAVKKRMDYQLAVENTRRRFEQEHMVNWIVAEVMKGITPQQEKEALNMCIQNLKTMSSRQQALA